MDSMADEGEHRFRIIKLTLNGLIAIILVAVLIVTIITLTRVGKSSQDESKTTQPTTGSTSSHSSTHSQVTTESTTHSTHTNTETTVSTSTAATSQSSTTPSTGNTPGWKAAAAFLQGTMNTSADPCEDFFEYACGTWIANHPLGNASSQGTGAELAMWEFNVTAKALDSVNVTSKDTPVSLKLAHYAYEACNNYTTSEKNSSAEILAMLNGYGTWPVLNPSYNDSSFNLASLMAKLAVEQGVLTFISPSVDVDWMNGSRHILYLDQATLGLGVGSEPIYLNETFKDLLDQYNKSIVQAIFALAKAAKVNVSGALANTTARDIVNIEIQLALINTAATMRRNYTRMYNAMTVGQLQTTYKFFDWTTYFFNLLPVDVQPSFTVNSTVVVMEPNYLAQLNNVLGPYIKKTLANYLLWRAVLPQLLNIGGINYRAPTIPQRIRALRRVGWQAQPVENVGCAALVEGYMGYAVGRLFVDNAFNISDRTHVRVLIDSVTTAVRGLIDSVGWLDYTSKSNADLKLNDLVKNAVYPDWILNNTLLDAYHAKLTLNPTDTWFSMTQQLTAWMANAQLELLLVPGDRYDFQSSPAVLNAWYAPELNSLTIPAGILQTPFYRSDYPMAMNFGGVGVVIGHETTHGFDDEGIQYFVGGELKTWMTGPSQAGFQKMADCVIDEYDHFCYPNLGICVNGNNTQGENIADNGGVKAAYSAYQAYVISNGEELRLPGLEDLTMEQVFFLNYGGIWCGSMNQKLTEMSLLLDVHSPNKYRVNGVLRNFAPFARAFQCKSGDPMYPANSCNVW